MNNSIIKSNLTGNEIDNLGVTLDKLEGQNVNIEYDDNVFHPMFNYDSFQGYEQDGLVYIGDINKVSGIDVDKINSCKITDCGSDVDILIGLANGSRIRIYN
jgi:hypothetical protein